MILDIARHKFYEAIITLSIFTTIVAVRAFLVGDEMDLAIDHMAPIGSLLMRLCSEHSTIAALAAMPIFAFAALNLARSTVRAAIYTQSTIAAISLLTITLTATVATTHYPILLTTAAVAAYGIGQLIRCFGTGVRAHRLFGSMFALGLLPLLDSTLMVVTAAAALITIFLRSTMRETLITICGITLPIFIYSYIDWLVGNSFTATSLSLWSGLTTEGYTTLTEYITLPRLIFFGVMLFFYLLSLFTYISQRMALTSAVRHTWFTLHALLFIILGAMFLLPCATPSLLIVATIIIAITLPLLLQTIGMSMSVLSYIALLISAIAALA